MHLEDSESMKKMIVTLLLIAVLGAACAAAGESGPERYLGQPMPDFTVTTITGETFSLSETLTRRQAVLVNFWATWCGPCEREFPFMQQAYERYQDQVEIIAISGEPNDTNEKLSAYAASHGMTFKVARDGDAGMYARFVTTGIPTSVLVDRFGNVVLISVGSQPSADPFLNAFELLTADDYTETRVFDEFPKRRPPRTAEGAEDALAAVLGAPFTVAAPEDEYAWPFTVETLDGVACVRSGNAGVSDSDAEMIVCADAKAGDALRFSFRLMSEPGADRFVIRLNGEQQRALTGRFDWAEYAVALREGENRVSLRYSKGYTGEREGDAVWLRDFALLSGDEATAALSGNPLVSYPYAAETGIDVRNEGAREIVFTDEDGQAIDMAAYMGTGRVGFWVVNSDTVRFAAGISGTLNCDDALLLGNSGVWTAYDLLNGELTDTAAADGYSYGNLVLFNSATMAYEAAAFLFPTEQAADAFETMLNASGISCVYRYADGTARGGDAQDAGTAQDASAAAEVTYTVVFTDQFGDPVPGCLVNFCTDSTCTPVAADDQGVATFVGAPYPYHLQVIYAPEGYSIDTSLEYTADPEGGPLALTVEKLP